MEIFPRSNISPAEEDAIIQAFSNPIIVKYLHTLAYNTAADLVSHLPDPDKVDESFIRTQIFGKGQLRILDVLLNLQHTNKESKS